MANHKSAKKRILSNKKKAIVNGARRNSVRTYVKKVEAAILEGNKDAAAEALKVAESKLAKAAGKGVFNKNMASRKTSRLAQRIKAL
ncbi:MAG: 30S ribosomal protein S20 [Lactobacillaceae bacterium]|jgi:small subunit ribosomal protein S20|nr:30S ribosomal protein S20 [Lactobacillaceae bacterium]